MEPTLKPMDYVTATPASTYKRGEIVVFEYPFSYAGAPLRYLISRIAGVPGDTVEVKAGVLYVNGEAVSEPYVVHKAVYSTGPVKVPAGMVYVLGDDRTNTRDSHVWGPLPESKILGVVELGDRARGPAGTHHQPSGKVRRRS